jgi:hypothetical protein
LKAEIPDSVEAIAECSGKITMKASRLDAMMILCLILLQKHVFTTL